MNIRLGIESQVEQCFVQDARAATTESLLAQGASNDVLLLHLSVIPHNQALAKWLSCRLGVKEAGVREFDDRMCTRVIAATAGWEEALDDFPFGDSAALRALGAKAPVGHPAIPTVEYLATASERATSEGGRR